MTATSQQFLQGRFIHDSKSGVYTRDAGHPRYYTEESMWGRQHLNRPPTTDSPPFYTQAEADAAVAALARRRLATTDMLLTTKNRLTAEPAPAAPDLGRLWTGELRDAAGRDPKGFGNRVAAALGDMRVKGLISADELNEIADTIKRVGDAMAESNPLVKKTRDSSDGLSTDFTRNRVTQINDANRRFHDSGGEHAVVPTRDSTAKGLIQKINDANRAFHGEKPSY